MDLFPGIQIIVTDNAAFQPGEQLRLYFSACIYPGGDDDAFCELGGTAQECYDAVLSRAAPAPYTPDRVLF